ncbi:trypsin-like serine protease [Peredibacter sp. HCB2-198]|uniref:trypsin-like serine protease n=1 Tax=Peredibacter sp. HCB2-198 TaxID=3383025 RepID=UPI0038B4D9D5
MKMLYLSLLLLLSTPFAGYAIIGGDTDQADSEGIVLIALGDQSACTATKIAPNLLITAAHCFDDSSEVVGFTTKQSNQEFKIVKLTTEEVFIHPSYAALGNENEYTESIKVQDIAIVKVSPSAEFEAVPTRELDFSEIASGEKLSFYGYGCTKSLNDLEGYFPFRKMAKVDSLSEECLSEDQGIMTEFYQDISSLIYKNNIVTPGKKRQSDSASLCLGDSGGPLIKDGKVVGINTLYTFKDITENGESETGISYLNLHARLSMAQKWVLETMSKLK